MELSRLLARLVGSRWLVRTLSGINVLAYRASGGRIMGHVDGRPVCLVTLRRRRSGRRTTIPLMYTARGDDVLLVASLGGSDLNPAWYYNLRQRPQIEVQVGRVRRRLLAREAGPDERADLWPLVVASFPSYAAYQRKTSRVLPIMICSSPGMVSAGEVER